MNVKYPESMVIIVLIAIVWICSLFLIRHHTYTTLDKQASECAKLKQVVDKTREFAMGQPNEVRVIFRNLGYDVSMAPAMPDTTSAQVKPKE